jgi:hypothetical protein
MFENTHVASIDELRAKVFQMTGLFYISVTMSGWNYTP